MSNNILNTHSGMLAGIHDFFTRRSKKDLQVKAEADDADSPSITKRQIRKVVDAVKYNYKKMDKIRKISKEMRAEFLSHLITEKEKKVILNKMQDAIRIWLQNMASGDPRVSITSEYPQLRAFASNFERAVNNHLSEIDIGEAFIAAVTDAMFGVGVLKTGLGAGAEEVFELDGETVDPGRPFTEAIHIDDFVIDMNARSKDKIDLIGHRYLRPKAWINEMVMKRDRDGDGSGISDRMESEMQPEEKLSGARDGDDDSQLYDNVWVWEIYLPKENKMVLFADGSSTPLSVWKWEGPEGGPYDLLGWLYVPGYPLPVPIASNIYELHIFLNEMVRKTGRQAKNQKSVIAYERGAEKAAEIIGNSNDLGMVAVPPNTLDKMKELKSAGADPMSFQSVLWANQMIDDEGGNLKSLGGIGPSAETARGDAMIHENASALIQFMQIGFLKVSRKVLKKHAWWVWTEDIRGFGGDTEIPGADIWVPWSFTPEEREGNFLDYNLEITPNSMIGKTPSGKALEAMQFWNEMILPNQELIMQSGFIPNAAETFKYICKNKNLPFDIFFKALDPAMEQQMQERSSTDAPPRLKQSHTINERISRPGTTPRGNDNVMMDNLSKIATSGGQR